MKREYIHKSKGRRSVIYTYTSENIWKVQLNRHVLKNHHVCPSNADNVRHGNHVCA